MRRYDYDGCSDYDYMTSLWTLKVGYLENIPFTHIRHLGWMMLIEKGGSRWEKMGVGARMG